MALNRVILIILIEIFIFQINLPSNYAQNLPLLYNEEFNNLNEGKWSKQVENLGCESMYF